jgi:tetrahydromethanopterin S-methyltransferase subunit E
MTLAFIFLIELIVSNEFNFYVVYLNELYPTQMRIIGVGFIKTFGSVTVMLSSQILNACLNTGFPIMVLFAILAAISIFVSWLLP